MALQGNNWPDTAANLRGGAQAALTDGTVFTFATAARPKLHLKWFIPPKGFSPNPSIMIPAQKITEFIATGPTIVV